MTTATHDPPCPKCGGLMWNNIATKRNPRAPNFKCRDRSCDGAIWPEKQTAAPARQNGQQAPAQAPGNDFGAPAATPAPVDAPTFPDLTKRYAETMKYVVDQVVPYLTKADIGVDPQTVASIPATLYIERNRRGV